MWQKLGRIECIHGLFLSMVRYMHEGKSLLFVIDDHTKYGVSCMVRKVSERNIQHKGKNIKWISTMKFIVIMNKLNFYRVDTRKKYLNTYFSKSNA